MNCLFKKNSPLYSHGEGNDTVRVFFLSVWSTLPDCDVRWNSWWKTSSRVITPLTGPSVDSLALLCVCVCVSVCVCVFQCVFVCPKWTLPAVRGSTLLPFAQWWGSSHFISRGTGCVEFFAKPYSPIPHQRTLPWRWPLLKTTLCWFENGHEWGGGGEGASSIMDFRLLVKTVDLKRRGRRGLFFHYGFQAPLSDSCVDLIWRGWWGGGGGGRILHWEFQASC